MSKGYSREMEPKGTARARGVELEISPKKAYEVCNAIRGMSLEKAEAFLEDVIAMDRPVKIRRYGQETAHKRGHTGPGRYPVKAAGEILKVLQNARSNAEFKGLTVGNMRLEHISANRGRVVQGRMQRAHGRSTEWNEQTTTIEIILKQKEEEK